MVHIYIYISDIRTDLCPIKNEHYTQPFNTFYTHALTLNEKCLPVKTRQRVNFAAKASEFTNIVGMQCP